MDGASNSHRSKAGLILASLRVVIKYTLLFDFNTLNNEAEYGALIASLNIAKELKSGKTQGLHRLIIGH